MRENLLKVFEKETVLTGTLMEMSTQVNGRRILNMDWELLFLLEKVSTKVSLKTERDMEKVFSNTSMETLIQDGGSLETKKELEPIYLLPVVKR